MIGSIIQLISWFLSLPVWVFVLIVIVIIALDIIVKFSDSGGSASRYSAGDYSYDNNSYENFSDYANSTNESSDRFSEPVEHPFVCYDTMGNRCCRGGCFYDFNGDRRSWGDGFYDGKGYYRNWGDSFYDSRGCFRSWGIMVPLSRPRLEKTS